MACQHPACLKMENAFRRMRSLAEAAKWPPALTPEVVAIDRAWQDVRRFDAPENTKIDGRPMLAYIADLQRRAEVVSTALQGVVHANYAASLPGAKPSPVAPTGPVMMPMPVMMPPPAPADDGWKPWAIGGGAVAVLALLAAALGSSRRSRTAAMSGVRRRRWR